jgi:hypothetical protein
LPEADGNSLDVLGCRSAGVVKLERPVVPKTVDTVERAEVDMGIERQGRTIPCRRESRFTTRFILSPARSWRWSPPRAAGMVPSRSADRMDSI